MLETAKGNALLIKKDIFRNLMWYILPDSNKHYPLSIVTVRKIKEMNTKGVKPEMLETEEPASSKPKEAEPDFVDVVGQISLRSLERNDKKRKFRQKEQREQQNRNQRGHSRPSTRPPQQNQSRPTIRKDKDKGKPDQG
jgi:hypothetical protein